MLISLSNSSRTSCILTRPKKARTSTIDKERYKKTKYDNSEEKLQKYTALMTAYGSSAGIAFNFHGTIANTFDAHRLIQHYQEAISPETANKIVDSLYSQYFELAAHPSSKETLVAAASAAGVSSHDAESFISDEYEDMVETRMLIREQASNGIDSVPYVVIEGKRRDFTLEGAKEVGEYVKVFESIAKESR
ncbi:MAG: hypothetical protein Q9195_005855 [Heterodermia aff. obscurata]